MRRLRTPLLALENLSGLLSREAHGNLEKVPAKVLQGQQVFLHLQFHRVYGFRCARACLLGRVRVRDQDHG
jgi:hypothetical protein